jgi:hypothetical protein
MAISNAGMAPWMLQAAMAASALKNPMGIAQLAAAKGVAPPALPAAPATPGAPPTGTVTSPPAPTAVPPQPAAVPAPTPDQLGVVPPPMPGPPMLPMSGKGDDAAPGAAEAPGGQPGAFNPFAPNQMMGQAGLALGALRPPIPSNTLRPPAVGVNGGGGFHPGAQQIMQMLMAQAPQAVAPVPSLGALIRGAA